jgi:UDP-N-acetylmuramyl pentapeptide phosphotransferase/UDP-N-acetylglucosamine-1-phosphate transferase
MSAGLLAAVLVPFAVAIAAIEVLRRLRVSSRLLDRPNERSLHSEAVPRVGGIGMAVGMLAGAPFFADATLTPILLCAAALAVVSTVDDARGLPISLRIALHGAAAIAALLFITRSSNQAPSGWLEPMLAALAIAWMTNLYNFMDGSDGLAGGMTAIGFGCLAVAAGSAGAMPLAQCCAAIAAAASGFLVRNFPPARVFMGDAGSIPLGFLAATVGLLGAGLDAWPLWFPAVVFSPFIVDATVTLARRTLRGERPWVAHRDHAYQRLVLAGWGHRRLASAAYALMLAAALTAFAARAAGPAERYAIISLWSAACVVVLLAIERKARASRRSNGTTTT